MSGNLPCKDKAHRPLWAVSMRNYNQSAFNGYHKTYSEYSEVRCTADTCRSVWRTKAAYVAALPDECTGCHKPTFGWCRICRQPMCAPCLTDHHHEGYGTPLTTEGPS